MKYFPYGGDIDENKMKKMSNEYSLKEEENYQRTLSLDINDILIDMNLAFQELSHNFDVSTLNKHKKSVGLLLIVVSIIGLLLLYIN